MIIRLTNTIGAIGRRLGIVTKNLQMWLGFYKSDVIGKELVVNGDFATSDDWTADALQWVVSGGKANGLGVSGFLFNTADLTLGNQYSVVFDITDYTSGSTKVYSGSGTDNSPYYSSVGTHSFTFKANASNMVIYSNSFIGSIDNVSIKEVTQFVKDKSTNSNDAKLFTGKALEFNGNDYVSLGSKNTSVGNLTATAWVELSDLTGVEAIFSYGDFLIRTNGSDINVWSDVSAPPATFSNVMTTSITRLVTTITGTSVSLYLNGVLSATQSIVALSSNSRASYIGSFNAGNFFGGNLSDIQLYDEAWDSDDALFDYNNPNHLVTDNPNTTLTLSNLSAYYALSEGSGSKIYDSTGLGAELVVDGDFPLGTTAWVVNQGTLGDGEASFYTTGSFAAISQAIGMLSGKTYEYSFEIKEIVGEVRLHNGGVGYIDFSTVGLKTGTFVSNSSTLEIKRKAAVLTSVTISNVSIKLVKADDGTSYDGAAIGATWVDQQPTIPQLGLMDWSKGSNLVEFSEPTTNAGPAGNISYESYSWGINGFTNATKFGSSSSNYRYAGSVVNGTTYTYSVFVVMDDGSEPNVTNDASTGDFSLNIGNAPTGGVTTVTLISGNIYRVSKVKTATQTTANNGVVQYSTQSAKVFRVVGYQLEESSTLGSYIGTNGSAASNATLIQNPNDIGKDVLGNSLRLRERGFNLDGSGYAEVANDTSLDFGTGDFSIEAWAKAKTDGSINVIVSLGGSYNGVNSAGIGTHQAASKFLCYVGGSAMYSNDEFELGDWYHLVVTRNSGLCTLYIDTVAQTDTETNTNSITNTLVKHVGRDSGVDRFYTDIIDEPRLYNRALTQKEITNNYKVGLKNHKVGSAFSTEFSSEFGF